MQDFMQLNHQMRKPIDAFTPWYLPSPNSDVSTVMSSNASNMLDCSSIMNYSCSSRFSDSSWTSHHDASPILSASSCFSSNASVVSPFLPSTTSPSWSGSNNAGRPSLDSIKPAIRFTPPTLKFNDMLDKVAQEHAPWSGVVTSKDAWYPINDVASQQEVPFSCPASKEGNCEFYKSESKTEMRTRQ